MITPVHTPALKMPSIASHPERSSDSGTIGHARRIEMEVFVITHLVNGANR
jgi:hypothetical protein